MDYAGDAAALAAIFAALTPPAADPRAVMDGNAAPPSTVGGTPAVYVYLDPGSSFTTGNGTRAGLTRYVARVLLDLASDESIDTAKQLAWATVLADALKDHVQIDGRPNVARAVVASIDAGNKPWDGKTWSGIDLGIDVTTSESWLATV